MLISKMIFNIIVWGSIVVSAVLMCVIFGYFLYELKQREIW